MKKNIKIIIILALIFVPLFASASLQLENVYPSVPGTSISLESSSTLGDTVKYFATWAIVLGGLISFISLVMGGVRYLTSTGNPSALGKAKTQLTGSLLGLMILLGSYIILATLNPQLTVVKVEKDPVVSGVFLLNNDATNQLRGLSSETRAINLLQNFIESEDAYPLQVDVRDLRDVLGDLEWIESGGNTLGARYENHPDLFGSGSLLFTNDNPSRVIFFSGEDFSEQDLPEGDGYMEFSQRGRLNVDGSAVNNSLVGTVGESMTMVRFYPNNQVDQFESPVTVEEAGTEDTRTVDHPPLSLMVYNVYPGIYLYGNPRTKEMYARLSMNTLGNISDEVIRAEIVNNIGEENHDFIIALHEEADRVGKLRILFERKPRGASNSPFDPGTEYGNTEENIRLSIRGGIENRIEETGPYGSVYRPSSITVSELSGDPDVCREVLLCTKPEYGSYGGACISYTPRGAVGSRLNKDYWLATSTFDIGEEMYLPQNITGEVRGEITVRKLSTTTDASGNPIVLTQTEQFEDNIQSIKIEGDCMVAIFENRVPNNRYSACDIGDNRPADCWEENSPGSHSQIFFGSNFDLNGTGQEINTCGGILGIRGNRFGDSCASSVAIYPIKVNSSE